MAPKEDKWKQGKKNINMWVSTAFYDAVEKWRKAQVGRPSQSKAVELLARQALGMPLYDPEDEQPEQ